MPKALWRDEVIYQIFIDRFAGYDGNRDPGVDDYLGGNIEGIRDNLGDISALGATCVYLTPFFKGTGYHGYHTTDFFTVDPRFGTTEHLIQLVAEAHAQGMKVMIDFVPNHCSKRHPYFLEAKADPKSQYRDWFYFTGGPEQYIAFMNLPVLPKFNLGHRPARDHIIGAALHWVETLGVDGIRFDHVTGPAPDFWQEMRARLKAVKPDLYMLAEVSLHSADMRSHGKTLQLPLDWSVIRGFRTLDQRHHALMEAYGELFDGYIDFAATDILRAFAAGTTTEAQARRKLDRHYASLSNKVTFATQLDNHDMDRIMFVAGNDIEKVRKAMSLQFSYRQPHIVYYGTEQGMTQDRAGGKLDEYTFGLLARQPMPSPAERDPQHPLLRHYQHLTGVTTKNSEAL